METQELKKEITLSVASRVPSLLKRKILEGSAKYGVNESSYIALLLTEVIEGKDELQPLKQRIADLESQLKETNSLKQQLANSKDNEQKIRAEYNKINSANQDLQTELLNIKKLNGEIKKEKDRIELELKNKNTAHGKYISEQKDREEEISNTFQLAQDEKILAFIKHIDTTVNVLTSSKDREKLFKAWKSM